MERIWSLLDSSQSAVSEFRGLAASSSDASPKPFVLPRPLTQVNDYVFEVCTPAPLRRPSVEMVFFHGLQLEGSQEPHINTWVSRDRSELWLNWFLTDFPDARILTVLYDAYARKTDRQGRTDRYVTGENLVHSLTQLGADVGQDGCPVVLVGHCIGGLVIKELCLQANSMLSLNSKNTAVEKFLQNLTGLFFYATPHHGTRLADMITRFVKGPLFEDVTTNNTDAGRRNEDFRKLRGKYGWRTYGVGEGCEITLGSFKDIFVTEASARHDVDNFYTVCDVDHFEICQPQSTKSSSFGLLSNFVADRVTEDKARHGAKVHFQHEVLDHQGQVNTILEKLEKNSRLALCGMGGIGKSTLAKMVYNKISNKFEYTCFVSDVKKLMAGVVTQEVLQTEIIKHLYAKDRKVDHSTFTWSTLQGKAVLIVLDDVNLESQVHVMSKTDGFSDTSRVIVTSRDGDFLRPEDFEVYFAKPLGIEDSKRLFCLHAFKTATAPSDYEDHVMRFTQKCEGFPLALKVAGRYLYKRSKHVWDDALEKLRSARPLNGQHEDGLWSILKMSFNSLVREEQEMFLDVAVVFHGERLSWAKRIWKVCGWGWAESGWSNLLDKGLVTGVSYDNSKEDDSDNAFIQMHEMLRDLGRNIACPDPQDILGHSRVCCTSDLSTWQFNKGKSKVKFLKIEWDSTLDRYLDFDIFCELHELEVLIIDCILVSNWRGCDGRVAPPLKLVYLEFRGKLYFGAQVKPMTSFRFNDERCLETFPRSLVHWKALKHLVITSFSDLKALPDSLGELQALEVLEISFCEKLEALLDSLGDLKALKDLTIRGCDKLEALPDSLGELQALEVLELLDCEKLEALPASLGDLKALKDLTIYRCNKLEALADSLGDLKALKDLTIRGCNKLEALPDSLGELQALEVLEISFCEKLEALPDSLGYLEALKDLTINWCNKLEALPDSLGELQALQKLTISGCTKLAIAQGVSYHDNSKEDDSDNAFIQMHEMLRDLGRSIECQDLQDIFGHSRVCCTSDLSTWQFDKAKCKVKFLKIEWDSTLDRYLDFDIFCELHELEVLIIDCISVSNWWGCDGRVAPPLKLVYLEFRGKRYIHVKGKPKDKGCLEIFPRSLGHWKDVKHLIIRGFSDLKALPDLLGELQALEVLEITVCEKLEALPDSLGDLKALKYLTIRGCDKLEALPDSLGDLKALKELTISGCDKLEALPDSLGELQALEVLEISFCEKLEALPASLRPRNIFLREARSSAGFTRRAAGSTSSETRKVRRFKSSAGFPRSSESFKSSNNRRVQRLTSSAGFIRRAAGSRSSQNNCLREARSSAGFPRRSESSVRSRNNRVRQARSSAGFSWRSESSESSERSHNNRVRQARSSAGFSWRSEKSHNTLIQQCSAGFLPSSESFIKSAKAYKLCRIHSESCKL